MARWLKLVLVFLGLALVVAILSSIDRNRLLQIWSQSNPMFLVLALITTSFTVIGKGVKWHLLMDGSRHGISRMESIRVFTKGFFLSLVTPGRVGDFSRALYVRKKIGFIPALASVLVDRLIDITLMLSLSVISLWFFFQWFGTWVINPLWIVAAIVLMLGALLYVLRSDQNGIFRRFVFMLVPEEHAANIKSGYNQLVTGVKNYAKRPRVIAMAFGIGLFNAFFSCVTAYLISLALGIAQPPYFFALVVFILSLIEVIPISIGGIGTREAGAIVLFSQVGLPAEVAVAFSLFYFMIGYLSVGITGGLLFIREPLRG